jgi:hypothetical protein
MTKRSYAGAALRSWKFGLLPPPETILGIVVGIVGVAIGYPLWGGIALLTAVPAVACYGALRFLVRKVEIDGHMVRWTPYLGRSREIAASELDSYEGLQTEGGGALQVRFVARDGQSFVVSWRVDGADEAIRYLIQASDVGFRYPSFASRLFYYWHGFNRFYRPAEMILVVPPSPRRPPPPKGSRKRTGDCKRES